MRRALHQLGIYQCYHMVNVLNDLNNQPALWIKAFDNKYGKPGNEKPWNRDRWNKILGLSQACCDMPAAVFSVEIANAYPEAKVIILNRDPEKWYESVQSTIAKAMRPKTARDMVSSLYTAALDSRQRNWMRMGMAMGKYLVPLDDPKKKPEAMAWFRDQYEEFRHNIAEERRIEYTIKDGWGPLCKHLGVPIPLVKDKQTGEMVEAPFPHVNDRETWAINFAKIRHEILMQSHRNLVNLLCQLTTIAVVAYALWRAVEMGSTEL